jgi:hypothetical protein
VKDADELDYYALDAELRPEVSLDFVKIFVKDEFDAQQYWEILKQVAEPELMNNLEDETPAYLRLIPNAEKGEAKQRYMSKSIRQAMESNQIDKMERVHFENPIFEEGIHQTMKTFLDWGASFMNQWLDDKVQIPIQIGADAKKAEQYRDFMYPDEENEKLWKTFNKNEVSDILDSTTKREKQIREKLNTKLTWKPVIIGVDGTPFFPTKVSIEKITGETVRAAKQEYLSSIPDQQTREDVQKVLSDRIKLCFYDTTDNRIIEGLFY